MSLRIAHNVEAATVHRHLRTSSDRMAVALERLSSGLRINSARDDAAGLGISERMRGQIRGLEQANRNIQDGISLLNTMEGVLNEVHSILQRARELAVMWNNDITDFTQKGMIRDELFALSNEIAAIERRTEFNGVPLLQDALATMTLQVGANQGDQMVISLVDLFGGGLALVRPNAFFAFPWSDAYITGFDNYINDVSAARSRIGATVNRLEHALGANEVALECLMSAESRIRDLDYATELTELTKQQVMQASTTTMLIFAQRSPDRILDLLG